MRDMRDWIRSTSKTTRKRETDMAKTTETSGGGCGCIGMILGGIVLWALLFGVTHDGRHYLLDCSCDNGVQMVETRP